MQILQGLRGNEKLHSPGSFIWLFYLLCHIQIDKLNVAFWLIFKVIRWFVCTYIFWLLTCLQTSYYSCWFDYVLVVLHKEPEPRSWQTMPGFEAVLLHGVLGHLGHMLLFLPLSWITSSTRKKFQNGHTKIYALRLAGPEDFHGYTLGISQYLNFWATLSKKMLVRKCVWKMYGRRQKCEWS